MVTRIAGNRSHSGMFVASLPQKRIMPAFVADGGRLSMTCNHQCIVIEAHQLLLNRADEVRKRAAPEIGAPDTLGEERIAREQDVSIAGQMKTDTARSVARRMDHAHLDTPACDGVALLQKIVDEAAL